MLLKAYQLETWQEKFGPRLLIGIAHCLLEHGNEFKQANDILTKQLQAEQRKDLPVFFANLLKDCEAKVAPWWEKFKPTP